MFKADKDVSYIEFEQVPSVLPNPLNISATQFYEFPGDVDIYESGRTKLCVLFSNLNLLRVLGHLCEIMKNM